jgi:hypothetical protein
MRTFETLISGGRGELGVLSSQGLCSDSSSLICPQKRSTSVFL